jgi:RHS repeat-associated protein
MKKPGLLALAGGLILWELRDGMREANGGIITTTKYYTIGGMRVAMHDGTNLYYFASDHLSSSSLVMNTSGGVISEQRYMPFGQMRDIEGLTDITETDFGYTGQRNYAYINLIDYRARWYSPTLGRFTQPDTIVPDPTNTQGWNRFSYVENKPIRYSDPTGHSLWDSGICPDGDCEQLVQDMVDYAKSEHNITVTFENTTTHDELAFMNDLFIIINYSSDEFVAEYLEGERMKVMRVPRKDGLCGTYKEGIISLMGCDSDSIHIALHEILHFIDDLSEGELSEAFMQAVGAYYDEDGLYMTGPGYPPTYRGGPPPNHLEDWAESGEEYFGWLVGWPREARNRGIALGSERFLFFKHLTQNNTIRPPLGE